MNKQIYATEAERGKGVGIHRIRRVTGYLTGDISTWNDAKRSELSQRVSHSTNTSKSKK